MDGSSRGIPSNRTSGSMGAASGGGSLPVRSSASRPPYQPQVPEALSGGRHSAPSGGTFSPRSQVSYWQMRPQSNQGSQGQGAAASSQAGGQGWTGSMTTPSATGTFMSGGGWAESQMGQPSMNAPAPQSGGGPVAPTTTGASALDSGFGGGGWAESQLSRGSSLTQVYMDLDSQVARVRSALSDRYALGDLTHEQSADLNAQLDNISGQASLVRSHVVGSASMQADSLEGRPAKRRTMFSPRGIEEDATRRLASRAANSLARLAESAESAAQQNEDRHIGSMYGLYDVASRIGPDDAPSQAPSGSSVGRPVILSSTMRNRLIGAGAMSSHVDGSQIRFRRVLSEAQFQTAVQARVDHIRRTGRYRDSAEAAFEALGSDAGDWATFSTYFNNDGLTALGQAMLNRVRSGSNRRGSSNAG